MVIVAARYYWYNPATCAYRSTAACSITQWKKSKWFLRKRLRKVGYSLQKRMSGQHCNSKIVL